MHEWTAKLLFAVAVGVFIWMGLFHVHQPIVESFAFRQTQTALSAWWIRAEGFSLAYPTPILGAPWSIPFEFPLYQTLVAWMSALFHTELDATGRVVNMLCSLAVCLPLYRSLRVLGVDRGAAHFANALYLTAPVYLFWSSTFMIEGLALLLAVSSGYYLAKMYRSGANLRDLSLFGLLLTLALLQKVTTGVFPAFVGVVLFGWRALRDLQSSRDLRAVAVRQALLVAAVALAALLIGYAWVKYTDVVKLRNEFGKFLTSEALSSWNYGTLEQRLSQPFIFGTLINRVLLPSTAAGLGLLVLAGLWLGGKEAIAKRVALLGVVLFLLPMAVLTNLHHVHDYYQTANLVFLMAAIGVATYALRDVLPPGAQPAVPVLMVVLFASNLYYFHGNYYPTRSWTLTAENNQTLKLAAFVRANTPADRPIIVLGYDWSSEVPYYAQRRGLAVPPWSHMEMDAIRASQRFLPTAPSAIVSCPEPGVEALRTAITVTFPQSRAMTVGACQVYLM